MHQRLVNQLIGFAPIVNIVMPRGSSLVSHDSTSNQPLLVRHMTGIVQNTLSTWQHFIVNITQNGLSAVQ
jgi:hypothetical protein